MSTGGSVGILNVGAGDTKLTFDKANPAECIRAARIVRDMIRRGYALLVEVEKDGKKFYRRAEDFDAETCEYIIADFDPVVAAKPAERRVLEQEAEGPDHGEADGEDESEAAPEPAPARGKNGRKTRKIHASTTRAVAVSRSAGG